MEHKIKFDHAYMEPQGNFLRLHVNGPTNEAYALCDAVNSSSKTYQFVAKPFNEKRSVSANAYCWVLCEKSQKQ